MAARDRGTKERTGDLVRDRWLLETRSRLHHMLVGLLLFQPHCIPLPMTSTPVVTYKGAKQASKQRRNARGKKIFQKRLGISSRSSEKARELSGAEGGELSTGAYTVAMMSTGICQHAVP